MSDQIQKKDGVEYVPFGSQDKIRLSIKIIQEYVAIPTRTGATCTQRDAVRFMMLCQGRRLNPFEGDCFLQGYDTAKGPSFELITSYQALIKRAEVHPRFDGLTSGVIVRDNGDLKDLVGDFYLDEQELLGAWCRLKMKEISLPMEDRVKLKTFVKMNDRGEPMARWKIDPGGMIVKVAEASCLRRAFPTTCGGLYLKQEVELLGGESLGSLPATMPESTEQPQKPPQLPPDESEGDLGPEIAGTNKTKPGGHLAGDSPQARLLALAEEHKLTFTAYQKWAVATGNDDAADSRANWSEIPGDLCNRFLRAKAGFIQGLKAAAT